MTTKKPTRRRRHAYSPELTDLICERLLDGTSLRQICQDKNMPARSAIFVWLAKHKEFARKYMIARHIQIDCLLGDMLDIADDCSKDGLIKRNRVLKARWAIIKAKQDVTSLRA